MLMAAAYAHFEMETIADELPGAGPLGGLVALLRSRPEDRIVALYESKGRRARGERVTATVEPAPCR